MTGFGKGQVEKDAWQVSVEIKSVNHRFKDIRFKMSSRLNPVEMQFREKINRAFKRGSFDIYVNYKKTDSLDTLSAIDEVKVKAWLKTIKALADSEGVTLSPYPTEFFKPEFQKDKSDEEVELLQEMAADALDQAIISLEESRKTEGKKLLDILASHRDQYSSQFEVIEKNADKYRESVEEKLRKKISDAKDSLNIDEPRLLQEVIYYLEKLDVHEEINRIKTHLSKLETLLKKDREIGRELDFLIQELNRETNTIGSKSGCEIISGAVVNMKSQLEKIREQALNLE